MSRNRTASRDVHIRNIRSSGACSFSAGFSSSSHSRICTTISINRLPEN